LLYLVERIKRSAERINSALSGGLSVRAGYVSLLPNICLFLL
jgi:hypothetical protein